MLYSAILCNVYGISIRFKINIHKRRSISVQAFLLATHPKTTVNSFRLSVGLPFFK